MLIRKMKLRGDGIANYCFCKYLFYYLFCLALVFSVLFARLYGDIDNYILANVKADVFSENSYCIFLGAILNEAIAVISNLLPNADVLSLFQIVFTTGGLVWLGFLLLKQIDNNISLLAIYSAILPISFLLNIAHCNYTVVAAFCGVIGFTSISFYLDKKANCLALIIGGFYILLGHQWRLEGFLYLCPLRFLG